MSARKTRARHKKPDKSGHSDEPMAEQQQLPVAREDLVYEYAPCAETGDVFVGEQRVSLA